MHWQEVASGTDPTTPGSGLNPMFVVLPVGQVFMWDTGPAERVAVVASHLALAQSWIPFMNFYWGGNGLAWSVSTEFFFYLAFPFLVRNFRNSWAWKLALVTSQPAYPR